GRLTLIKAVIGSLRIYYLSSFKAPEVILKSLERLRGMHIGSLKAFNLSLLQKWLWRLFSSLNAHWVKVIKALHGQEGGLDHQVKEVWSLVRKWCDISFPLFMSYDVWKNWICSWHVPKEKSLRLYVIFELHFGGCGDIVTTSLFVLNRCGKVMSLIIFDLLLILGFLIGDAR
ncbi:hypothetical protein Tco_1487158, partial [Tanacetum coccineum]